MVMNCKKKFDFIYCKSRLREGAGVVLIEKLTSYINLKKIDN